MRPRSEWATGQKVTGPPIVWSAVDTVAIHYTAAPVIPADVAGYLRAIQNDYSVNRGYSVGYNVAVDQTGGTWELRGFDIKCAANKGHNEHTFAILVLVNGNDPASDEAAQAIRDVVAVAEQHARRELVIAGHRDIGPTACPGVGLYNQLRAGLFSPRWKPLPPRQPDPTPPPEDDDVLKLIVYVKDDSARTHALVCIDGGGTEMIGFSSVADKDTMVALTGLKPEPVSAAQYDDFVLHALAKRA